MPATALASLLTLSYPFLIYFGQGRVEPRLLAGVLVGIALLRALSTRQAVWYWAAAATLLLAAFSMLGNGLLPLKLYPLLVNAVLLAMFAGSLSLATALWADNAVWTAYNGCISYLLMGALFGGEWLVRQRVKSRNTTHG